MRVLVVGIGNPWASDDGVGAEVIRQFQNRLLAEPDTAQSSIEMLPLDQPGFDLLDFVDGCGLLIIVDAVSTGAVPGTLHRVEWRSGVAQDRGVERVSSHGLGVREVLDLAAALGRLPHRVELWGIEAGSTAPGANLSPAVAGTVPAVVELLVQALALPHI